MTKVEYGSILITSTGPDIIILNDDTLDVTDVVFWVADSNTESAAGYYDGSSTFTGSAKYSDENASNSITYYKNISGTKTKVFEMVGSSLDVGEIGISTTTLTANIKLNFVARGN